MNNRRFLAWCGLVALVVFLLSGVPASYAYQTDERCFAETGQCISGRIRAYWEQNNGLRVFGYPITAQREEVIEGESITLQWFERNRLELHPQNDPPYDVLLGRLGADQMARLLISPQQPDTPRPGCQFFVQTGFNVCDDMLVAWQANGLELDDVAGSSFTESLALSGLPLSREIELELADGKTYTVQYFERSRFERHPENAAPYNVLFGLLGNELIDSEGATAPTTDERIAALVKGQTTFALNLYQELRTSDGNLFYSPYSIHAALSMTAAGARRRTQAQMLAVLRSGDHPAYGELNRRILGNSSADDTDTFRLTLAHALWGQQGYAFEPAFLDTLATYYDAELREVDFASDPNNARRTINDRVSQQTEGRIADLLPEGAVNNQTRMVLTNAIAFKSDWMRPFAPELTRDDIFTRLDGSTVTVPMMNQTASYGYAASAAYQIVSLPYQGTAQMVIVLPAADSFADVEAKLTGDYIQALLAAIQPTEVALSLPTFTYDARFDLADTLASMGMQTAFLPGIADFSGIDGSNQIYLSGVFHQAFVAVDEQGTEAAAATGVVSGVTSAQPMPPLPVRIDRPFIYLIQDTNTGALLFIGRVLDPSA